MFNIELSLLIWRWENKEIKQACRHIHIHTKKNAEVWETITYNRKQKKKEEIIGNTKENNHKDG